MPDHDDTIETQLRAWAEDLARQVPTGKAVMSRRRRPWAAAAALAAAAVLVAVLLTIRTAGDQAEPVAAVGGDDVVRVDYERLEYEQEASLTCPGEPPREATGSAVFEVWGDRDGKQWRNVVTYPDGTTRELIVRGSPWYPTSGGSHGHIGLETVGCGGDIGTVVAEPGQGSLLALNPRADIPRMPNGSSAVLRHTDTAEIVPGEHNDSVGRKTVLWRSIIEGSGSGSFGERPLTQTDEWFVDESTGDVLERTFEQRLDGIYVARWRLTATEIGQRSVPTAWFSTDGFDPIEIFDAPWESPEAAPTTEGDSRSDSTPEPNPATWQEVSGVMQLVGGASGTAPMPAPGTITATDADGRVAASVPTNDDGSFALDLEPGTYTITGRSDRYNNGQVDCVGSRPIHVANEDIANVEVSCTMR